MIGSGGSAPSVCGFVYFIKVPKDIVDDAVATNGSYTLSNNIKRVGDDDDGVTAELTIGSKANVPGDKKNINKSYEDWGDNGYDAKAGYTIEINPDGKKLSNEDYLDISDIFKITGYKTPDGVMHNGMGLLDATISSIVVEDMDDLDSQGAPKKITDYVYIPEYNKTTTEEKETNHEFTFYDAGANGRKWIGSVKSGEQITLTIKGPVGATYDPNEGGWQSGVISYRDGTELWSQEVAGESLREKIPAFTIGADGTAQISVTVPNNENIKGLGFELWSNSSLEVTEVTGVAKETVTSVDSVAMSFQVPDEKHLKITYYYNITVNEKTPGTGLEIGNKPPVGSEVFFQNEASVNTSDGRETDEAGEQKFVVQSSHASSTAGSIPRIEKVDIGNYAINDLDATFKLAKYDDGKWIYATEFTT
ncbi:MAG: hypothetical protein K2H19_02985, partial [Ruminococcus sp.]|nr:hypothetical protein [Ruminococcus sp.]